MASLWLRSLEYSPLKTFQLLRTQHITSAELTAIYGFGFLIGGCLIYKAQKEGQKIPEKYGIISNRQRILLFLTTSDIAIGLINNVIKSISDNEPNTTSSSDSIVIYSFLHILHIIGIYYSYRNQVKHSKDTIKYNQSLALFLNKCYIRQIIISSFISYDWNIENKSKYKLIGFLSTLPLIGDIFVDNSIKRSSIKYIMCLYHLQCVLKFIDYKMSTNIQ